MKAIARFMLTACALFFIGVLVVSIVAMNATQRRASMLAAEHSLAETRHGSIEYVSWGEGPPVLVVHGAGGGFDQSRLLAEAMGGDGVRFIAVSRFGYLGSSMPDTPSTAAQAEAFVDLLDALGVERVSILAMSGGVPPALKFAEMFPDRVDRMMLVSSAPFTPFSPHVQDRPAPTWAYAALLGNDVIYWTLTKVARQTLEEAFDARANLRGGLSDEEAAFVRDLIDAFVPASQRLAGVVNEGAAVDPMATYNLEDIRAEVLVVHARDDRLNPFEIGAAIAAGVPRSRFIAFDSGGHLLLGHHEELSREFELFVSIEPAP